MLTKEMVTWDPGWKIVKILRSDTIIVYKDGLNLWAKQYEFVPENFNYEKGNMGYLRIGKEFRELIPGFYFAFGNAPLVPLNQKSPKIRIYMNIKPKFAFKIVEFVTEDLNELMIPFHFKILKDSTSYFGTDSGVIYLDKYYINKSIEGIKNIYYKSKNFLNPDISVFTKKIADGFALAEDPDNGMSFGEHRSTILAKALYNTIKKHSNSIKNNTVNRMQFQKEIIVYLEKCGINIEKPFLNHGNIDDYDIILENL